MLRNLLALFLFIQVGQASELKVLSWNTFMLPKPIKNSMQKVRTISIINHLRNYQDFDAIFLQEAFTGGFREKVASALFPFFPHSFYLGKKNLVYPYFGSGVFVLSKKPIKVLDTIYFKDCKSHDCHASKGAVLIELRKSPNTSVQFVLTHLQSKESLGHIRMLQVAQIDEMLNKHQRENVVQVLMGDLNIDQDEAEFKQSLELLKMNPTYLSGDIQHTSVIDCYKSPDSKAEWIDHMWVRSEKALFQTDLKAVSHKFDRKGEECEASDHYAISGIIKLMN